MTEEELIHLTRGLTCCDEGAWRAFHDQHFQWLRGLVISRGVPACDAPEIVQGVYLRVLRHAKIFRDAGAFEAWLACLVRCEVIDTGRKKGRRNWLNERFQQWHESKTVTNVSDAGEQLEEALLGLEEKERLLIRHHYLDGWSQEKIAEQHQVSVKAIESKLARLRKRLRQILIHQTTTL
jgi:RNA polymerase sigma factor (sigma-70 family)